MRHGDLLEVQSLHTDSTTSVLFARFSAGWTRRAPVRCTAAEEFVVLDGTLELNGIVLGPASVAHVPVGAVRATTTTTTGCTAVAWFVGPLGWEDAAPSAAPGAVLAWHPSDDRGATGWVTALATWSLEVAGARPEGSGSGDAVDLDDPGWARLAAGERHRGPSGHRVLRRTPRVG